MNKGIIILTFIVSISSLSNAQKNISHTNQQWIQYYNQINLTGKLALLTDISSRRTDFFNEWSQITFRTGISYPINKNIQGVSGVAIFNFYNDNKPSEIEFREYQEVNSTVKSGKVSIQHRLRSEARYFRVISNGVVTSSAKFNFRFRYRFLSSVPIAKLSDRTPERKILLNIGDEIFINISNGISNLFDQNRILIGATFQFNNNLYFSLTYNHQFTQRYAQATYQHSDILWLGIIQKLSLKHN